MKIAPILLLLLLILGCNSAEKRTYDVALRNDSTRPVTIWLTKNGPPWEDGWKSPEDLAIESPRISERIAGVIVPPGKIALTGKVTGSFLPNVDAIIRVYRGQLTFSEILAVSRGNTARMDIPLKPGINDLVVTDLGPGVTVHPAEAPIPR
jgi:hypothetical protein